jgi:hypothetical protein
MDCTCETTGKDVKPLPAPLSDTLIFVSTYNERGAIEQLLDALLALLPEFDVLVVDDNSNDGMTKRLLL